MRIRPVAYIFILLLASCGKPAGWQYVIGFSQCADDEWRCAMDREMEQEALFYDDISLIIRNAGGDSKRQSADIEAFIEEKVDLLVVSPNEEGPVAPAVEKACDAGIPVIVADRNVSSDKITAFVGADNFYIGKSIGQYVSGLLPDGGKVVEITGLMGSTPAKERHEGFTSALSGAELSRSEDAGWMRTDAYDRMLEILRSGERIDVVFAHNDEMAYGAYMAAKSLGRQKGISFIGVDALSGPGGGQELVRDGILNASFIYPSGGDRIIQTAVSILHGKPYDKVIRLGTSIVDKGNVRLLEMQSRHIEERQAKIAVLNGLLSGMQESYRRQRQYLTLSVAAMAVMVLVLIVLVYFYRQKKSLNRQLASEKRTVEQQKEQLLKMQRQVEAAMVKNADRLFLERFDRAVSDNLGDENLSMEKLCKELSVSRVQLYRKVKSCTGESPSGYIRTARLKKAHDLLLTTDLTAAEVCYTTGFNSPSYFAKCFKSFYGALPSDYVKQKSKINL